MTFHSLLSYNDMVSSPLDNVPVQRVFVVDDVLQTCRSSWVLRTKSGSFNKVLL